MRKIGSKTVGGKTTYPPHFFRWRSMKSRCSNPNFPEFVRYGARGIKVCEEWLDFLTFKAWCDATFEEGKTLDRIDNDGPYAPWNCRWATPSEQQENSRKQTPARLAGMAVAKRAQVKALHKKYGHPGTRTHKVCSRCKQTLPVSRFAPRGPSRPGHTKPYCRPCAYEYHKARGWK